ncbi:MAG TPA: hypothetical protein VGF65_08060, partial [Mycobacterium sp.]
ASNPAAFNQSLAAQPQAPRRNLLTATYGGFQPTYSTVQAGTIYTFMYLLPIEAAAHGARIGIANQFSGAMQVLSAAIYPVDSYGEYATATVVNTPISTNRNTFPTMNSVYQTGTLTNGSNQITGLSNTALLPTGTVYLMGAAGIPLASTVTIVNGTTAQLSGNFTGSTNSYTLQFANLATECKMYFDNGGAWVDQINTAGTARGFTVQGNPNSPNNNPQSYTIQWSDLVPCLTLPRSDGGTNPLLQIYLTIGTGTVNYGYVNGLSGATIPYNALTAPGLGNRFVFSAHAWSNAGTDWTDNPGGVGFLNTQTVVPALVVQYLTDAPGWNVLQIGDSISASAGSNTAGFTGADTYSTPVMRACKLLSTPLAPCEWASMAWGGTASAVYLEASRKNAAAMLPSAVVGQPVSRNDGSTLLIMEGLQAKYESYVGSLNKQMGTRLGYLGAFPFTTTADGSVPIQTVLATMKNRLATTAVGCTPSVGSPVCPTIPVLDPIPVLSRAVLGGNFWDYLAVQSTANGAAAAGATTINITTPSGANPCYTGDILTDATTPAAINPGSTVLTSSITALTTAGSSVIGGGILNSDTLVCSMPGWTGGAVSHDNTHPQTINAMTLLQPAATRFVKQLLGISQ